MMFHSCLHGDRDYFYKVEFNYSTAWVEEQVSMGAVHWSQPAGQRCVAKWLQIYFL